MKKTLTIITTTAISASFLGAGTHAKMESGKYSEVTDSLYDQKWQSSDILDAKVYSHTNKVIGSVKDFELSKEGTIEALYVELDDGLLGLFDNTVVRVDYDSVNLNDDGRTYRVNEDSQETLSQFISNVAESTREGVDYVADKTEKTAESLMAKLQEDKTCKRHAKNVDIKIDGETVYLTGSVESEEARDRIEDVIEDNTRMRVINNITIDA